MEHAPQTNDAPPSKEAWVTPRLEAVEIRLEEMLMTY